MVYFLVIIPVCLLIYYLFVCLYSKNYKDSDKNIVYSLLFMATTAVAYGIAEVIYILLKKPDIALISIILMTVLNCLCVVMKAGILSGRLRKDTITMDNANKLISKIYFGDIFGIAGFAIMFLL